MPEGGDIERIINLDITNRELESGITYKDIIRHVQNDWMKSKPHITEVVLKIKDGDVIKLVSITRKDYFEVIVK
jgi:predicted transcriptional regulator YheO